MPTYPNKFVGPPPLAFRARWAFVFGTLGFVLALLPFAEPRATTGLLFDGVVFGAGIAGALLGWFGARLVALRDWAKLPPEWKVDPITIDDLGVSGAFGDPLSPSSPHASLTIPYHRIGNVRKTPEGYWVSGWEPNPSLLASAKAFLERHPEEVGFAHLPKPGRFLSDSEVGGGRSLSEVPRFERGGFFVLSPENGLRLRSEWERHKAAATPVPGP